VGDLYNKYCEDVIYYKERMAPTELTVTAFFTILLQQIGIQFRSLSSIYWESGNWKLSLANRIARIRALCDLFIELLENGRIEHPVTTLNKILVDAKIDPDDVIVNVTSESTDEEVSFIHPDDFNAPNPFKGRKNVSKAR